MALLLFNYFLYWYPRTFVVYLFESAKLSACSIVGNEMAKNCATVIFSSLFYFLLLRSHATTAESDINLIYTVKFNAAMGSQGMCTSRNTTLCNIKFSKGILLHYMDRFFPYILVTNNK